MPLICLPIKSAIFIKSIVITTIQVSGGYEADMSSTPELYSSIKNGIALVPALFFWRIIPEKHQQMEDEIAALTY